MSRQRGRGIGLTFLGFVVLGYIAFRTVQAWWVANRDTLLSGIGHRLIEPGSFAFYGLFTLWIVFLRIQAARRPARGVSHPVTLADLDPVRGVRNDGSALEQLTADLIIRDGGSARRCGGSGDGGVDVAGTGGNGRPVVVQCKQYAADAVIGPGMVRELVGAAHLTGGQPAVILVTTAAGFSDQARAEARQGGVVLVDRRRLHAWMAGGQLAELAGPRESRTVKLRARGEQLRQRFAGGTGGSQWPR